LQGFVFSSATPQNVKKRILPVAYSVYFASPKNRYTE